MNRRAMASDHPFCSKAARGAALLLAVAGLPLFAGCDRQQSTAVAAAQRPPLEGSTIGGEFALVDKNGKTVRYSDFAGKYRIVYFGYSFCPDACPLDVQKLMQGFTLFEKAEPKVAAQVQPIFISIDPERDTPAVVGQFAAAFSPRLLGLTGSPEAVAAAAKKFAAYYAKGETTPGGGYLMDHSRTAFLMDRDGKPLAILPIDQSPQAVAAEIARWTH
ncbi:SCO family protein [Novosphingobium tardum]|uniref:SCO family protein n=1 Tax=Novosphingobium tardum TaxID=1538021 RepID=A0ABV8RNX8_9SPHN